MFLLLLLSEWASILCNFLSTQWLYRNVLRRMYVKKRNKRGKSIYRNQSKLFAFLSCLTLSSIQFCPCYCIHIGHTTGPIEDGEKKGLAWRDECTFLPQVFVCTHASCSKPTSNFFSPLQFHFKEKLRSCNTNVTSCTFLRGPVSVSICFLKILKKKYKIFWLSWRSWWTVG